MKKCTACEKEWSDELSFCISCGAPLEKVPKGIPKKKLIIIGSIVAGVIAIVLSIGALTNWFGLVSPLKDIYDAAMNTIDSESITINGKAVQNGEISKAKIKLVLDTDKEDLILYRKNDNIESLLVDDTGYILVGDSAHISDEENFVEEFYEVYNNLTGKEDDGGDLEDFLEYSGLDSYIDEDEAEEFLHTFYFDYLCDEDWLEEYLGFEEKGNVYTFSIDYADLIEELIDICLDSDALSRQIKKNIKSERDDILDEVERDNIQIDLSFTVSWGKLTEIEYSFKAYDESGKITYEFIDIDDTEISEDDIDDFIDEVEDLAY